MDYQQGSELLEKQQAIVDRLDAAGHVMANLHLGLVVIAAILALLAVVELVKRWTV